MPPDLCAPDLVRRGDWAYLQEAGRGCSTTPRRLHGFSTDRRITIRPIRRLSRKRNDALNIVASLGLPGWPVQPGSPTLSSLSHIGNALTPHGHGLVRRVEWAYLEKASGGCCEHPPAPASGVRRSAGSRSGETADAAAGGRWVVPSKPPVVCRPGQFPAGAPTLSSPSHISNALTSPGRRPSPPARRGYSRHENTLGRFLGLPVWMMMRRRPSLIMRVRPGRVPSPSLSSTKVASTP